MPTSKETDIALLKTDAISLLHRANEVANITSPIQEREAAEFLKQVDVRYKKAEAQRSFLVKPLNDHVKRINAEVKQVTVPLLEADAIVSGGLSRWRMSEQVQAAREAAANALTEGQEAIKRGDLDQMQTAAEDLALANEFAPKSVITESGKITYRKTWKFEIEDETKIPKLYWMIDDKKLSAAVKAGIPIDGVKAWQIEVPIIGS